MSGEINVTNPDKPKKVLIVIAKSGHIDDARYPGRLLGRRADPHLVRVHGGGLRPTAVLRRRGGTARG
jgi:hypothetical protein